MHPVTTSRQDGGSVLPMETMTETDRMGDKSPYSPPATAT